MVQTLTAYGWHTEQGRRAANEDAILAGSLPDGRDLIALADGMGGHNAGEVASQSALETMLSGLNAGLSLAESVSCANDALFQAAQRNPEWAGMGTTLVALLRDGAEYVIANVGDSRAYRITRQDVHQLTVDHTVVAEALSSGRLTAADAEHSQWRNALTRAVGTDAEVAVDCFGPFDATEPHAVLLCSDGVYGSVAADDLRQCVLECGDPESAAARLTLLAVRNGSRDNASVAIAIFGGGFGETALPDTAAGTPGNGTAPTESDWPASLRERRNPARLTLLQRLMSYLQPPEP